jgi:translation initiation factor IF-2
MNKGDDMANRSSRPRGNSGGASSGGRGGSRGGQGGAREQSAPTSGARPAARQAAPAKPKEIVLPEQIVVRTLAEEMQVSPIDLIKALMNAGIMANINQVLDHDTAAIIAEEMGFAIAEPEPPAEPEVVEEPEQPVQRRRKREYTEEELARLVVRPPVVVVMGHVDHGKTSILDVIRKASVQVGEAGGITQHIGAYQTRANDKLITFLDTPGHEAFTAMRARGASVTDIAILVVAADDGVQPQTREAIAHARAAGVPIVVALNKIDLATANPDRVKQQLADEGLVVEDWGGDVICVPVSARTKQGIDELLDMVLLVAEMENLRADPKAEVAGSVIEGRMDRSMGPTATLLVQEGTLREGDTLLVGQTHGRIRAMFDYQGNRTKTAGPATPVVVTGLRGIPVAGDRFRVVDSEREARQIVEERVAEAKQAQERPAQALTLDQIYERAQSGAVQSLNLVLKADVDGSLEPIRNSLDKLEAGDLRVKFVHVGVGNINESDVNLAVASQAVVVGFNVGVDGSAVRLAEAEGVSIRTYDIIYRLIEDIQMALTGMLEPEYEEVVQGQAVVREVFTIPRVGKVAGVQVRDGRALRNASARVKRNGQVIHEGRVTSLRRFTEDVREVGTGLECGVGIEGLNDLQPEDTIEFYTRELVQ